MKVCVSKNLERRCREVIEQGLIARKSIAERYDNYYKPREAYSEPSNWY